MTRTLANNNASAISPSASRKPNAGAGNNAGRGRYGVGVQHSVDLGLDYSSEQGDFFAVRVVFNECGERRGR